MPSPLALRVNQQNSRDPRRFGAGDQDSQSNNTEGKGPSGKQPGGPGGGGPVAPKPARGMIGLLMFIVAGVLVVIVAGSLGGQGQRLTQWQEFTNMYSNGQIDQRSVQFRSNGVYATQSKLSAKGESSMVYFEFSPEQNKFFTDEVNKLTNGRFEVKVPSPFTTILVQYLPLLIIIGLIWFLIFRGLRGAGGGPGGMLGSFGKSRHKVLMKEKTGITFSDVAGI